MLDQGSDPSLIFSISALHAAIDFSKIIIIRNDGDPWTGNIAFCEFLWSFCCVCDHSIGQHFMSQTDSHHVRWSCQHWPGLVQSEGCWHWRQGLQLYRWKSWQWSAIESTLLPKQRWTQMTCKCILYSAKIIVALGPGFCLFKRYKISIWDNEQLPFRWRWIPNEGMLRRHFHRW